MKKWCLTVLTILLSVLANAQSHYNKVAIILEGTGEYIVRDPLGRKSGADPLSKQQRYFDEIPEAFYGTGGVDSENPEMPGLVTKEFEVENAISGTYELHVIGTSSGKFELDIYLTRHPASGSTFGFNGVVSRGQSINFAIAYHRDTTKALSAERKVNPELLLQDIHNCYTLNLLKTKGIYTSLRQKAQNAIDQQKMGQKKAAMNTLQAFISEIRAQKNKGVDPFAASILIEDAEALIKQWS